MLVVKGLTKHFGGVMAVQDLSFTLNPGEILGFIGPNGAGKSTVFNLLTGLYHPDRGRCCWMAKISQGFQSTSMPGGVSHEPSRRPAFSPRSQWPKMYGWHVRSSKRMWMT